MKYLKRREFSLPLIAVILLSLNGCVAQSVVKSLGRTTRTLIPQRVFVGTNGSIVIESDLYESNDPNLLWPARKKVGKRFVIGSRDQVLALIGRAHKTSFDHKAHEIFALIPRDLTLISTGPGKELPSDFVVTGEYSASDSIPYNTTFIYVSALDLDPSIGISRKWWSGPAQLLFPLAIILDIITAPIQVFLVVKKVANASY